MRPYRRVVLGGTFDRFHRGHEAMLRRAFAAGDAVAIGVTSDAYLAAHPKVGAERIQPYAVRTRRLRRWLGRRFPRARWTLVPLEDRFGRSVERGPQALVVSPDTLAGGRAVNAERRRRRLPPLDLLEVPLVLADDLEPVSSTRLRAGAIDADGRRRSPISVVVAAEDADDARASLAAVRRVFPRGRGIAAPSVRWRARPPAARRARRLLEVARRRGDLAIGVARGSEGWWVAVGSRRVALAPRRLPGRDPSALADGLVRTLAASRRKPI